jgi:TRAP transporter 4TM/12TM fusion protein
MANGVLSLLMKIGLVTDEIVPQRKLALPFRLIVSLVAVAYSLFFIYVAFFGSPPTEVFKGTFLLGTTFLCIVLYKGRQRPMREGFVWLDEFFSLVDLIVLCGAIAIWIDWQFFSQIELWRNFSNDRVWIIAGAGGVVGALIYVYEAVNSKNSNSPTLSDILFLIGGIAAIAWWILNRANLTARIGGPVPTPVIFYAGILAAASFEIARRIVGPVIPLLGFLFFVYSFELVAQSMPGLLWHAGDSVERVMEFLLLSTSGMTGLIIEVFATYIVIFVILGAFLKKTGLDSLIIDATYRITGQRTGGPGLAAVFSSALFGMISGSGVANVMTTGTFTIPLMKRIGYKPEFAAAVEAAASTGGAYMPPIMGAGAFLLAQLTETSYLDVVKIATIPAVLYYLSVGLIVYLRAARRGLRGVPVAELPPLMNIFPRLHLLLPIPVMVYLLVRGDSAFLAAAKTIVLIVLLRAVDLLATVRTPWHANSWKYFIGLSLAFGTFVYVFGVSIGGPFVWFIDTYRGIAPSDCMYWVVLAFIVLKLGEIIAAGTAAEVPITAAGGGVAATADRRHGGAADCLTKCGLELVKNVWQALEGGAKNTLVVSCIAGVLGILLSAATQSDLPGRVSLLLVQLSFGLLPLTIFWVIVAGYVIGMGLPITASYVILAIFAVGALNQLGVSAMTAHMISYWLAVVSAVTPPVALAAYAASAIAKSDPIKTGFQATKIASMIFVMPIMFVYTALLLDGTVLEIVVSVAGAVVGVIAWAVFLEGYALSTTTTTERTLVGLAAVILLLPVDRMIDFFLGIHEKLFYETYIVGAVLLVVAIVLQAGRRLKRAVTASSVDEATAS